jgi:sugar phosphate isomerase/epimerase
MSTGCFYNTSIFECLEDIRGAGFSLIEVVCFPAHLDYRDMDAVSAAHRRVRELGLEAYSVHAPFSDDIDITSPDEGARAHARDELLRAVQAAATLGARHLVVHPGPEHGGGDAQERTTRAWNAVQVLDAVAGSCRQRGVRLVLENMLPHLFAGPFRRLMWIIGAMSSSAVGVCLDVGHAQLAGELPHIVEKLPSCLRMIHLHDNRGNRDDHLPPGQGHVDWRALLDLLRQANFSGGMMLELAKGDDKQALLASARAGRLFVRELCRELALEAC